jgi:hypothetical protein
MVYHDFAVISQKRKRSLEDAGTKSDPCIKLNFQVPDKVLAIIKQEGNEFTEPNFESLRE